MFIMRFLRQMCRLFRSLQQQSQTSREECPQLNQQIRITQTQHAIDRYVYLKQNMLSKNTLHVKYYTSETQNVIKS